MDDRGFASVTPLAEAREILGEHCEPHGRTEVVAVGEAAGRVLATPARAGRAVPHYDRAAMDGYAVRAEDTFDATERSPVYLAPASEHVGEGEAVQVHTGSPLPGGADAVVMVEHTERRGEELAALDAVTVGENVAPAGEDVEAGEHLFDPGRRLRPSDLALLRTSGTEAVEAYEPSRVSVIPTGEEVVDADPAPGEVVETNGMMVSALAERWGATASHRGIVTDDETALREAIEGDTDHDVVVTTGGSSVGERDLVAGVVADWGDLLVHGVAIKPGHPVGVGVVEGTPVLLLPGYPVSCLVTAVQLLRPALAAVGGITPRPHPTRRARLTEKLTSEPGRRSFARVRFREADGSEGSAVNDGAGRTDDGKLPAVEPVRVGGAGVMSSVAFADGWVVIPESREGIPAGETVEVQEWELPW